MIVRIVITAVVALALGFGSGWIAQASQEPNCPTEDSCAVDYHDGEWHIEPDVP